MEQQLIKPGDYVIVQRQKYTKLYKVKQSGTVSLGKDIVEMDNIIGHKFYETFRMVSSPTRGRLYTLEHVPELTLANQVNIEASGIDNRNIIDDGTSQSLSTDEICKFRDEAFSSTTILDKLITNSKTFAAKTEYSQEKYIKKKEKKYFEFIQVRKPTLRLVADIFSKKEIPKCITIRTDDLSQIVAYSDVQSEADVLLYDSGSSGVVPATVLNAIGPNTSGRLIYMHPGNECQKTALQALQFPLEQTQRCICVNIYSVLRTFYQGYNYKDENKAEESTKIHEETPEANEEKINEVTLPNRKRAHEEDSTSQPMPKKTTWQVDNEKACSILSQNVDAIIVVAKEHPVNICKELLDFLKPGRSLVVYSPIQEPLEELYFYLKSRKDFIAVRLVTNFMRNYQILPERTHPEINMNFGGFLLTAFKVKL